MHIYCISYLYFQQKMLYFLVAILLLCSESFDACIGWSISALDYNVYTYLYMHSLASTLTAIV